MIILYCDASFDYKHTTQTTDPFVRGKIAISDGKKFNRVEKVIVGKVPNLKQYINILELTAVARAVELAIEIDPQDTSLKVITDSKVAMFWARSGKIKPPVLTDAHKGALEYLSRVKLNHGGIITFNHVLRDGNPAGKLLEVELEKEAPHTI